MTYEEAHAYLENQQREFTTHRGAYADDLIEANGMAILAIEKQIPNIKIIGGERFCPKCDSHDIYKTNKYCPHCGQALDWSTESCDKKNVEKWLESEVEDVEIH